MEDKLAGVHTPPRRGTEAKPKPEAKALVLNGASRMTKVATVWDLLKAVHPVRRKTEQEQVLSEPGES
jgi:hypothetical protein